jgi:hypothetical protein
MVEMAMFQWEIDLFAMPKAKPAADRLSMDLYDQPGT